MAPPGRGSSIAMMHPSRKTTKGTRLICFVLVLGYFMAPPLHTHDTFVRSRRGGKRQLYDSCIDRQSFINAWQRGLEKA